MTSIGLEFRAVLMRRQRVCGRGVEENGPCVRDDDVVDGRVPATEAREAESDYHCFCVVVGV